LGRLHQGELEAMILSQELNIDYVILDDLLARRKAQRLGLKVIGTIGLLLFLEKRGSLSADQAWQKLRQLTEQHNMDLSPKLLNQLRVQFLGIQ
jgi:predicted nucleic acid-binding protein